MSIYAETIAQHHRRVGTLSISYNNVAQMRRALALRESGVGDTQEIVAQARVGWWIAGLPVEQLRGYLEVDEQHRPIEAVGHYLDWHAPVYAGKGWTLHYDPDLDPQSSLSLKIQAKRATCPPSSRRGIVKSQPGIVVSEFCFYRLARWLGLPAAPVQLTDIPQAVQAEAGSWSAGALIWWVDDARRDEGVWHAWDDNQAMRLVALERLAFMPGDEEGELHRASDGTPFSIDNQDAFHVLRGNMRAEYRDRLAQDIAQAWQTKRQNIPPTARLVMRAVWQQVADIDTSTFCQQVLYDSPFADRVSNGWPDVQQAARALCQIEQAN